MLQSKKKTQVLETLLDLVNAYSNFFHEGRSYYQDLDVFNQQLAIEIDAMKNKTNTLDKQLEKRHTGEIFSKVKLFLEISTTFEFSRQKVEPIFLKMALFKVQM